MFIPSSQGGPGTHSPKQLFHNAVILSAMLVIVLEPNANVRGKWIGNKVSILFSLLALPPVYLARWTGGLYAVSAKHESGHACTRANFIGTCK